MFVIGYLVITITSFAIAAFLNINLRTKVWLLALLMAIFGFFIVPDITSRIDALPYLYSLDNYREILNTKGIGALWHAIIVGDSLQSGKTQFMTFQSTPAMGILMFFCTFLPNPFFLSLIAFLDYFFALKIIALVTTHNHFSDFWFGIGYLAFMGLFVYTNAVGGVRNNLVGTVYAYFFLQYVIKDYSLWSYATIRLCIIATILSLIHPFTLLLFLLSMLVIILHRTWEYRIMDVLLFFQHLFQKMIISFLMPLSTIPFFGSILDKSDQYLGSNITLFISSRANWVRDFIRLLVMMIILIVVCHECHQYINSKYIEFVVMLMCFICGSVHDQVLFERCLLVLLPIMLPFITIFFKIVIDRSQLILEHNFFFVSLFLIVFFYIGIVYIDNLRAGELYYTFLFNSSSMITGI